MNTSSPQRCPACLSLPDESDGPLPYCRICTLWHGRDVSVLDDLVPLATPDARRQLILPAWNPWLARLGLRSRGPRCAHGWGFTTDAAERLAQHRGWNVVSRRSSAPFTESAMIPWRYGSNILLKVATPVPKPIAAGVLGVSVICRPDDLRDVAQVLLQFTALASEASVVIDTDSDADVHSALHLFGEALGNLKIHCARRGLQDDFSAQRNCAQRALTTRWALHMDADERPTESLLNALGWLIPDLEKKGRTVCGLGRRNWVDGELTAAYPDYQYRLLRTHIPWVRRVHEVPQPCETFSRVVWSFPQPCLDHILQGSRLAARRKRYGQISKAAGKTRGQLLLERPYSPTEMAPTG